MVNLAPADTKKTGSLYDLPILLGILSASGRCTLPLEGSAFVGELSLDGQLRPVNGVLSMVLEARRQGLQRIFIPYQNAAEGSAVPDFSVYPVQRVEEIIAFLQGKSPLEKLRR